MFLKSSPLFLAGLHSDSSPFIKESMDEEIAYHESNVIDKIK